MKPNLLQQDAAKHAAKDVINMEIDCLTALVIVGQIQLACTHPENPESSIKVAVRFAKTLEAVIGKRFPMYTEIMALGWDPKHRKE